MMVTVSEASEIIFNNLCRPGIETVKISGASRRVLAEGIGADRALPPFDRVAMDGIAISHDEWQKGRRDFPIEGIAAAGESRKSLTEPNHCFEVMTGAMLPEGCDTVVRYEDLRIDDGRAFVNVETIERGQSVHVHGMDAKKGEVLLQPGQVLSPSEIALLASVGKASVGVFSMPPTAIISTGDELVDVGDIPEAWQIRRSNAYAVQAAFREMGYDAECFHLKDDPTVLRDGLEEILSHHQVLILSGGVSKGKFDYIPQSLEALGIKKLFHQVSQRPGKPFWFGASGSGKIAFALPGNPVSTFMCFYKYIQPWIMRSMGVSPHMAFARLEQKFSFRAPLTCFLQVAVRNESGVLTALPVPGGGSGDFANLKNATGFLELPLEKSEFRAGEVYPLITFRH